MKKYDYIFCWLGASASLLLSELDRQKLLKHKDILIIEKEQKNRDDKTFCFWSKDNESISRHLKSIISKSWDFVFVKEKKKAPLSPYKYHKIQSIDVYTKSSNIIEKYNIEHLLCEAEDVWKDTQWLYVTTRKEKKYASIIFDSRTPSFEVENTKSHIYQSFVGWTIETKNHTIDPTAFTLMDFNIEQLGATQFIYILPVSSTKALVEVTRFGKEILQKHDAENILKKYISSTFWPYTQLNTEIWCIPMSHYKILRPEIPWVIHIWARNYQIKASTGYAFKNMYYQAFQIAEAIKNTTDIQQYQRDYKKVLRNRFSWYDSLFLDVLRDTPKYWKNILSSMIQNTHIQKVFAFLDEKTSLSQDISLFYVLPWKPFLYVLYKKYLTPECLHSSILLFIVLCFIWLGYYTPFQIEIGYVVFLLWLLFVGIPHGAVDHLLETHNWNTKTAPIFLLRYMALAGIIGGMWYFLPQITIIVFLIYSMWHFWEADGKIWNFWNISSFLWGMTVLVYILGTHREETNQILLSLWSSPFPMDIPIWTLFPWIIWGIYKKSLAFIVTNMWLCLSSFIPLLLAFGIYFIGQHSMTWWWHLKKHLKKTDREIWIASLPFHIWAWILLIWFYFFWPSPEWNTDLWKWGIFFIFLACISFPHVIHMHTMYQKSSIR